MGQHLGDGMSYMISRQGLVGHIWGAPQVRCREKVSLQKDRQRNEYSRQSSNWMVARVYVPGYKDHRLVRVLSELPIVVIQYKSCTFYRQITCLLEGEPIATSSCREVPHRDART